MNAPATVAVTSAFLKALVSLVRAEDRSGVMERFSDAYLLKPFIVTKEARRGIPIVGDPSPEVLARVEQFYKAACLCIEQRSKVMASPVIALNHEGFGRVVLVAGQLAAFSKSLRDVHRFGFDAAEALDAAGEQVVEQALRAIETFPEVARA